MSHHDEVVISPEQALEGLLGLGGLSYSEILRFTGWTPEKADGILDLLIARDIVRRNRTVNQHLARFWLARDDRAEARQPWSDSSHSATFLSSVRSRNSFS